jgi:oligosaccharyltransferase complex subunit gamma
MKFLSSFSLFLLPLGVLAAKPATADKFQKFYAKSVSKGPQSLDDASFEKLTTAPRDYSIAVLLTAMEKKYGCQLCRDFAPEWELFQKSWIKGDKAGESRFAVGTLDFNDGGSTFRKVRVDPILFLISFGNSEMLNFTSSNSQLRRFCCYTSQPSAHTPKVTASPSSSTSKAHCQPSR